MRPYRHSAPSLSQSRSAHFDRRGNSVHSKARWYYWLHPSLSLETCSQPQLFKTMPLMLQCPLLSALVVPTMVPLLDTVTLLLASAVPLS